MQTRQTVKSARPISFFIAFILLLVGTWHSEAQLITIDDFTTRNTFAQKTISGVNWMKDGRFYTSLTENKIVKFDISTGQAVETIFDGMTVNPAISIHSYSFSADEKLLLVTTAFESLYRRSFKAQYFVLDVQSKEWWALSTGGKQSYATFSPDGSKIAFVRENNLFYVTVSDHKEVQIASDGRKNSIINGTSDWVYEEELGFVVGFYWSPDSEKIAYYRFDESGVREYNLQKWNNGALYPEDYRYKYPKPGEANALVDIMIYHISDGKTIKANTGTEEDIYIPRVKWTLDPMILSVRKLNRRQNELTLYHVDAAAGESKIILTEKNDAYIDIGYTDDLLYLKDGKQFVMSSERSGYKHFYLYELSGKLLRSLTSGNWEATKLIGLDEKAKQLYYLSTEGNYLNRTFFSISLDGKKKVKLSQTNGVHTIDMSTDFQFYLDYASTANEPLTVSLYKTKDNKKIKVLEENLELKKKLADYNIVPKEFFQYLSADGITQLDGYIMKPALMEKGKKYPLLVFQYSGPRSNSVSNSFGAGPNLFWHQMLVQRDVIVAVIDTRGTGSRGEKFTKQTYKQLGKLECEDLAAAAQHFSSLEYVDGARLAIWGWSYGGYTTSLVMTKKAGAYKLGIAGAPVTTWRYYDNIYTERFLQRPSDNPSGYDDNSPLTHAAKLQGPFLLIHGTGDDNVHFQNSVALEDALINAGKQFRSHFYPDQAHGFRGAKVNHHKWTLMTDFIMEHL